MVRNFFVVYPSTCTATVVQGIYKKIRVLGRLILARIWKGLTILPRVIVPHCSSPSSYSVVQGARSCFLQNLGARVHVLPLRPALDRYNALRTWQCPTCMSEVDKMGIRPPSLPTSHARLA
jgi:hypothetical protein